MNNLKIFEKNGITKKKKIFVNKYVVTLLSFALRVHIFLSSCYSRSVFQNCCHFLHYDYTIEISNFILEVFFNLSQTNLPQHLQLFHYLSFFILTNGFINLVLYA